MSLIYGLTLWDDYRKAVTSVENAIAMFSKTGEISRKTMDGIEYYEEIGYTKTPPPLTDIVMGFGAVNKVGFITIIKDSYDYLQKVMRLNNNEITYIKRFFLHHEYGHLRDMYDGKRLRVDSTDKEIKEVHEVYEQYKANARPFEIVADKYAINDLNLSLDEYKYCRNMGRSFLQRLGNDESLNYAYSRTKVWETRHNLTRMMF